MKKQETERLVSLDELKASKSKTKSTKKVSKKEKFNGLLVDWVAMSNQQREDWGNDFYNYIYMMGDASLLDYLNSEVTELIRQTIEIKNKKIEEPTVEEQFNELKDKWVRLTPTQRKQTDFRKFVNAHNSSLLDYLDVQISEVIELLKSQRGTKESFIELVNKWISLSEEERNDWGVIDDYIYMYDENVLFYLTDKTKELIEELIERKN